MPSDRFYVAFAALVLTMLVLMRVTPVSAAEPTEYTYCDNVAVVAMTIASAPEASRPGLIKYVKEQQRVTMIHAEPAVAAAVYLFAKGFTVEKTFYILRARCEVDISNV